MEGQHVCVVGAGNSAGQAAAHLAKYAERVTLLARGGSLARSMSEYLILELEQIPNVQVRLGVEVIDGDGSDRLEAVTIRDRTTGSTERIPTAGLFVLIGGEPHTSWLEGTVARNAQGYVLTGPDLVTSTTPRSWPLLRPPLHLETNIPGVFAIGDVRFRSVKRVASAVGEGASVVQLVHQYLGEGALASVPRPLATPAPQTTREAGERADRVPGLASVP
jgi:thioredoxin reductase (NADPH)